jgi:hypothetical protein
VEDNLTNEKLRNKFTNQFELVSYAIKLAANMIHSGRAPRVKTDTQNVSMNVLAEIASGKDILEEIVQKEVIKTYAEAANIISEVNGREHTPTKSSERKKSRIIQ